MPKALSGCTLPLNGLFAIAKPSGPASMAILDRLKPLFANSPLFVPEADLLTYRAQRARIRNHHGKRMKPGRNNNNMVKMGQGGTLDPLADGVLVIGVGKGTKLLQKFLTCTKEYHTTCLAGCETDSYDSEGARVRLAPYKHITRFDVEAKLPNFRGEITQLPPIYSALKMQGKPLYEYAREGIPLPEPIKARKCTVSSLEVVGWTDGGDQTKFKWPEKELGESEQQLMSGVRKLVKEAKVEVIEEAKGASKTGMEGNAEPSTSVVESALDLAMASDDPTDAPDLAQDDNPTPPTFELKMTVSSGTYVRSIVHDIGHALGSAAHVVTLTRTRQGEFKLNDENACVPWSVFEEALQADQQTGTLVEDIRGEDGEISLKGWEERVLQCWREDAST